MTHAANDGGNQRFDAVLSRLDALLKHEQGDAPAAAVSSPDALPTLQDEAIPLLTDVYEGETADISEAARETVLPLLEETAAPAEQTDAAGEPQQPDAYFGRLAAQESAEQEQPPVQEADYGDLTEQVVDALMPVFQKTLATIVREETERGLEEIRAGIARRAHLEAEAALRARLAELLKPK